MVKNKGMNPVAAGVIGAAVGAAVGAAAVELIDERNRKTVQKKLGEFKKKGGNAYTDLKKKATEVKDKLGELSSMAIEKAKGSRAEIGEKVKKPAKSKARR